MQINESNILEHASDLHELSILLGNNPDQIHNAFDLIMTKEHLYKHYVTCIDELNVFVNIFAQDAKYKSLILADLLKTARLQTLVSDTDALFQLTRIFNQDVEKELIVNAITKDRDMFRRFITDKYSLKIVMEHFPANIGEKLNDRFKSSALETPKAIQLSLGILSTNTNKPAARAMPKSLLIGPRRNQSY